MAWEGLRWRGRVCVGVGGFALAWEGLRWRGRVCAGVEAIHGVRRSVGLGEGLVLLIDDFEILPV